MRYGAAFRLATVAAGVSLLSLPAKAQTEAETRVLDYVREHLQPGQPLLVTELYGKVFTQPDERQALNKLYNAFFRIPLFAVQYQEKFNHPPSLKTIVEQFDLGKPAAAEVLLRLMESDPRVPRFLTRDPKTGEITHVDVEKVRSDPRFGQVIERQLGGWEGRPAPEFTLPGLDRGDLASQELRGKPALLYVWFTGCPPCMKETPDLVKLDKEFAGRGVTIVAANADRLLGLSYDDTTRRRYLAELGVQFPAAHWTKESDHAFGSIAIFPTLFLIDAKGVIIRHWVGYVNAEELRAAFVNALKPY
ncbi:MAG: TlpA family protein disulfide reductase [Terriglobia bacterium]